MQVATEMEREENVLSVSVVHDIARRESDTLCSAVCCGREMVHCKPRQRWRDRKLFILCQWFVIWLGGNPIHRVLLCIVDVRWFIASCDRDGVTGSYLFCTNGFVIRLGGKPMHCVLLCVGD